LTAVAFAVRRVAGASLRGLPEVERALLSAQATPKRRAEFVAGRSAARAAVRRLLGAPARGCVVLREEWSARPTPVSAKGARLPAQVSITHASGFAVAVAGASPLGVDLVEVEPIERAFRDEAFLPHELAAWEAFTGDRPGADRAACVAFAAKEAALKWLGTGLALPLLSVSAVPSGGRRPGRLGRLAAAAFTLEVCAPGRRQSLEGWLALPGPFALVAVAQP